MRIVDKKEKIDGNDLMVKRFYHSFKFFSKCPKCGKRVSSYVNNDYLSYPSLNAVNNIPFGCGECNYEWKEKCFIRLTAEVVKK